MGSQSRPQEIHRPRVRMCALAASLMLVLSGCAAAAGEGPVSRSPGAGTSASPNDSAGAGVPAPRPTGQTAAAVPEGPSAAATMVCGEETRANIVRVLSLPSDPDTTNSWTDRLYTCTYGLPAGPLVLSVKEASDPQAARAYFEGLQQKTVGAVPVEGMANLGFPAFQTPVSAVFAKDNFVLTVDAAALPDALGPHDVSRDALAYQIATAVLACWSE